MFRFWITAVCVITLCGLASGQNWQRHTIDDSSRGADGVRLADVNHDGLADIVTGWEEGGVIRLYCNPGPERSKHPWPAVTVGRVRSPEDAVFADLDGDGSMDVISSCEGGNKTVFVHWGPADAERYMDANAWQTEAFPVTQGQRWWMFAVPLQVDGRYGVDLIVGAKNKGAVVGWLKSPRRVRDVSGWRFQPLCDAGWIMSLQLWDMDADGDLDILVSDRKGPHRGVYWLENPGCEASTSGTSWTKHPVGGEDREVMFLTRADLDQDGRQDILCAVRGRGISFFRSTGQAASPWEDHEIPMPANCGEGKGVAVCDVDGDGHQDVIFTCEKASDNKSGVRWLSYESSPVEQNWRDHEISGPEGVKFDRIELLDMDADGDQDVLTCEERDNLGVIWYENPAL